MKRSVTVSFETQNAGSFSCIVEDEFEKFGLIGYGKTAREAEADMFVAADEIRAEILGIPVGGDDRFPVVILERVVHLRNIVFVKNVVGVEKEEPVEVLRAEILFDA